MLHLRHQQLRDNAYDAGLVRAEAGGELRLVQIAGFTVRVVEHGLAAAAEGSGLAGVDQLLQLDVGDAVRSKDDGGALPAGSEANLDFVDACR